MVTSYRISEVAERTGIPATTLRYYEDAGVVPAADRTDAGYRLYDKRSLARFEFVANAKQLGLSLDEIKALVELWDGEECAPVQAEMARLVDTKIFEMARRSGELVAFANELQSIAARLRTAPAPGPCDDDCACAAVGTTTTDAEPVAFVLKPSAKGEPVIACTLSNAEEMGQRVDDWQRLLAEVTAREAIDGGLRMTFPPGESTLVEVARLAAAELTCCAWVDFTLRFTSGSTILDVQAPAAGRDILASVFGVAS